MVKASDKVEVLTWMYENLKIIDMGGNLVPLGVNFCQRAVHETLEKQRCAGKPIRAIICKARREGVSSYVAGRYFAAINANPNRFAVVAAADLTISNKLFGMIQLFEKHQPQSRATDYSSRKEIKYSEPWRSQFLVQTAGTDVLGRGGLTHYLHISELAFIKNAKKQLAGIAQEVPDLPDTAIILESTANGVSGAFHDMFVQAVEDWRASKDLANYHPIFLPWFIFPEYQMAVPEGYYFEIGKAHNCPVEWVEDESELVAKFKLCNEQLYWRRWAIRNKCQGDLDIFHAEYPATWRESFVSSGRSVFLQSVLDTWEPALAEGRTVLFDSDNRPVDVTLTKNCWRIWKLPAEGDYILGLDTQEGKPSDPDDPKSDYDWHGGYILSRDSGELVAEWHGQGDQHELGEQTLRAMKCYNNAFGAVEVPCGMVVLDVWKQANYENIYRQQKGDYQQTTEDKEDLGWRTTQITRPKMIEDFKQAVNNNEIRSYSIGLLKELREFQVDRTGKATHAAGGHDDLIFGAGIALQLHKRLPYRPKPYEHSSTVDIMEDMHQPSRELARHNAIDTWSPGGADNDDDGFLYTD